jgi:hypothetical protein
MYVGTAWPRLIFYTFSSVHSSHLLYSNTLYTRARIFKQSMGARNQVGIRLSYRPAWLHRLAEFIP